MYQNLKSEFGERVPGKENSKSKTWMQEQPLHVGGSKNASMAGMY